jgi:hypothetical protein
MFAKQRILKWMAMPVVLLLVAGADPQPKPTGNGDDNKAAASPPMTKAQIKAIKQERKNQNRARRNRPAPAATITPPTTSPPTHPTPLAEDFDWNPNWEQKDNHDAPANRDYGYSATHHLAAAGCAPGEIGGSLANNGISWFADKIAGDSVLLDAEIPLIASGWCTFAATDGSAMVGWFNASTYATPQTAPDSFIGWRQNRDALCAALGVTGSSLTEGARVTVSIDKPFQWTLTYSPTAGDNACGQLTLSIGDSSSTLSLTQEQRKTLSQKKFNRFGIVTGNAMDKKASTFWLDDLTYTRLSGLPIAAPQATAHTRTAFFDSDPTGSTWLGVNNLTPHNPVTITQDYKYQPRIGGAGYPNASGQGCIGGLFSQAIGIGYYGYEYAKPLHFTDKLRSEGYVQFPSAAGENFQLGWTSRNGMGWREPNTLAFRFVRKRGAVNVSIDIATRTYNGAGGGAGVIASCPAGPQWHHYVLEFDPGKPDDPGTVTVQFDDKTQSFELPPGKKAMGADFDLFGLWNHKIPATGSVMTAYVDDVKNTVNGQPDPSTYHDGSTWFGDFTDDPKAHGWVGRNNSFTAKDYIVRPKHEFGWAGALPHLDGLDGYSPMYVIDPTQRHCMGGIIYLSDLGMVTQNTPQNPKVFDPPGDVARAFYGADLGGTLNAKDHHFYATGRFKLDFAETDAAELFGWFNSANAAAPGKDDPKESYEIKIKEPKQVIQQGWTTPDNFLGVEIHGGSANGYSMMPAYKSPHLPAVCVSESTDIHRRVYADAQWREFYMEYDATAAGGKGQLKLQIGNDGIPFTYDLQEGAKGANGDFAFDRFGLLTMRKGGGKPHAIYFDKLTYTVAQ